MKSYYDIENVNAMKQEIIDRYGPTIHGVFVKDMTVDRVSRIFVNMKLLEKRMYTRKDHIPGQISLFDKELT